MKNQFVRGVGLTLALALMTIAPGAQGGWGRRPIDPPQTGGVDSCSADGIRCIFGRTGGCKVICSPGKRAVCVGASCPFGFPIAAECYCQ